MNILPKRAFISHDSSCVYDGLPFGRHAFGDHGGCRMNEVSAAVLHVQLQRLESSLHRLHTWRNLLVATLATLHGLRRIHEHDPAEGCGTHLGCLLEGPDAVAAFRAVLGLAKAYALPINGLGHSFLESELLHERRGATYPRLNPLADRPTQGSESLPTSSETLNRCVTVGYGLDADEAAVEYIQRALAKKFG